MPALRGLFSCAQGAAFEGALATEIEQFHQCDGLRGRHRIRARPRIASRTAV
jgi:hypothetical protein